MLLVSFKNVWYLIAYLQMYSVSAANSAASLPYLSGANSMPKSAGIALYSFNMFDVGIFKSHENTMY